MSGRSLRAAADRSAPAPSGRRRRRLPALAPVLAGLLLAAPAAGPPVAPALAAEADPAAPSATGEGTPAADRAALERQRGELEAAIAERSDDPAPKIELAEVLLALDEHEAARSAVTDALADLAAKGESTGPLAADARFLLATVERRGGNLAAAIRQYQATLAADSDRLPALIGLAGTLAEAGFHREAIPAFGIWIQEAPDDPAARLGAATAMILAGEHSRARVVLEEAHRAMPDNLDILDLLARHLAASPDRSVRDGERAVELALRLVDEVPTAESHETLAMAYAEADHPEAAIEVQSRLVEELGDEAPRSTLNRWQANLERYRNGLACCAPQG